MSILPSGVVSDRGGDFALVERMPEIAALNVANGKGETYFRRRKGPNPAPLEGPLTARAVLEKMVAAYRNASSYQDLGSVRLSERLGTEKNTGPQGRTLRLFGRLRASQQD